MEGSRTSFSVTALGNYLTWRWSLNGVPLWDGTQADGSVVLGSSSATLILTGTTGAESDGTYTVTLSNPLGSVTSSAAVLSLVPPGTGASTFKGVGYLSGVVPASSVRATSEDGQIAVGSGNVLNNFPQAGAGDRPVLWTSTAPMKELTEPATITSGVLFETASDITPDGAVIAGRVRTSPTANLRGSAIWSNDGKTLTVIPEIAGYSGGRGAANSISADGRVVYGWSSDTASGVRQAYRWTAATGTVALGFLNALDPMNAPSGRGVSADGSAMVGTETAASGSTTAYIYRFGTGMSSLGFLPGGTWSASDAITPDGTKVLGAGSSTLYPGGEYFTWTQGGGVVELGVGDPNDVSNTLAGLTADGNVFAAGGFVHNGNGFMDIARVLSGAGLSTTGWSQFSITGMSRNGRVLFGEALDPSGNGQGWVATFASGYLANLLLPAAVTDPPTGQVTLVGGGANFGVGAGGGPNLTVQWYLNGVALADGTQSDGSTVSGSRTHLLQLANLPLSASGGSYTAGVHDGNGNNATSAAALLTVMPQPMVSVLLSGDPVLRTPFGLAASASSIYVAGSNANASDPNRNPATGESIFSVPIAGGAATSLYPAAEPQQLALIGADVDWIDPTSGSGSTQILRAPAAGGGSESAIYSNRVNPAIASGTGLASDGILLYALDSSNGRIYRLNADGSGLASIGGMRYPSGPQTESLAVDQGVIYAMDSGESSGLTEIVSVPASGPSTFRTLFSSNGSTLFTDPQGIAVGGGMIYVSDVDPSTGKVTIIWVMPVTGGTPVALVSGAPFSNISALTFAHGILYAADSGSGTVYQILVNGPITFPSITAQPSSQTAAEGGVATFTVAASGNGVSFQWYLNGVVLSDGAQPDGSVVSGAQGAALTLTGTTGAESDGTYTVVVTNLAGSVTSSAAVLSLTPPGAGAFTFTGVGDLPGGGFNSQIRAATDDGQIAGGSGSVLNSNPIPNGAGDRPVLWTSTAGISELPEPAAVTRGTVFLTVSDITPDGAVIAGRVRSSPTVNLRTSAIWSNGGRTLTLIPEISGYSGGRSAANAISGDGKVVYGWSTNLPGGQWQAYRWTAETGTVGLGFLNASDQESIPAARGSSADGSVVVGADLASDGVTNIAFIYKVGVGMSALGSLAGGTWTDALAVTPDGVHVIGSGNSTRFPRGEYFTWTQGGGLAPLGVGNPYDVSTNLAGVSTDGQVFAGGAYIHNANGFMALDQTLAAAGLNIAGWSHLSLNGMNHNGKVLFGQGVDPSGFAEGWVARVAAGYLQGLSLPATITRDPPDQTAVAGSNAGFGVGTSGGPGLAVQWFLNGVALADGLQADGSTVSGSASPYLQLANIAPSSSGGAYSAVVLDGNGKHATSAEAFLTVVPQPLVSILSAGDPALGGPLSLATDGTFLYAAGTNLAGPSDPNTSTTGLSMFRLPLSGGAATSLCPALEPQQLAVLGGNLDWIDPSSGLGSTQILQAPAGGGPVAAIYSQAVTPAISAGFGLATDGTYLYALDSSDGQLYRLNADGSGLKALGGARYVTGQQAESVAVYQGNAYVLESGETSLVTDIVTIPTNGSDAYATVWDNSIGPFYDPQCIAVGDGMIYVSDVDVYTGQVTKIWVLPVYGGDPALLVSGAPFNNIVGLAYANGILYVSDQGTGTIYQIQVTGP